MDDNTKKLEQYWDEFSQEYEEARQSFDGRRPA